MGCGNTKTAPVDEGANKPGTNENTNGNLVNDNNNGLVEEKSKKKEKKRKEKAERKLAETDLPAPKPIAFDINFNDENPFKKPPPPRLSRLAPLENAPLLTHQQLVEKLENAEVARSKELEKKRVLSRRSSRRRLDILQAKEFDKENQLADVDFDLRVKEEKRQQALEAKREKARKQEERRQRVRAKARRLSMAPEEEAANLDLERDMTFNRGDGDGDRDEVDSWLGDSDKETKQANNKLREIPRDDSGNYSISSGPRGLGDDLLKSSMRDRGNSAQTIDSLHVTNARQERVKMLPDDESFFDS